MPMSSETLESFLNFCESLVSVHIRWIADPAAHKRVTLHVTIEHFLTDCDHLFGLEMFKAHKDHPAFLLLRELYEKINDYQSNTEALFDPLLRDELPSDSNWIKIQILARKTQAALNTFIKEKQSLG